MLLPKVIMANPPPPHKNGRWVSPFWENIQDKKLNLYNEQYISQIARIFRLVWLYSSGEASNLVKIYFISIVKKAISL